MDDRDGMETVGAGIRKPWLTVQPYAMCHTLGTCSMRGVVVARPAAGNMLMDCAERLLLAPRYVSIPRWMRRARR